ncbi:MAG: blue light receptor [Vezdaea aestivalis]|nr:MAG: blue light receptor [Vezdaea aestivalis]
MPLFEENMIGGTSDGLDQNMANHGLPMTTLDTEMTGIMDSNGGNLMGNENDIMNSLDDLDMLPITLDVPIDEDPLQEFSPVVEHSSKGGLTSDSPQKVHTQPQPDDDDSNGIVMADNNSTGAGAGPLPTGFGAQAALGGGSTLTEFTKRRNWSQRVLEELQDFLHILTPDGRLIYVSQSCKALTGHNPEELVNKFIMNFIHPDDSQIYMREFNESIASGNSLRFFHRFRKPDNSYAIFESHGHPHLTSDAAAYGVSGAGAGFCRGFFMMSRPYPTKNAALLDSFLEHKIENERLVKRISDLKREEKDEYEAATRHAQKKAEGRSDITPSETIPTESGRTPGSASMSPAYTQDYGSMGPPAKPASAMHANGGLLTRQALDEKNASSAPDSIYDKMARSEGSKTVESIEIHTGLHYGLGERARDISTGGKSPRVELITGDMGIPVPTEKDRNGNGDKNKKKMKVADEYVCTDCGTLDSPEWRKGPQGPKTLCNACGLRWAKKEKKRTTNNGQATPGINLHGSAGS